MSSLQALGQEVQKLMKKIDGLADVYRRLGPSTALRLDEVNGLIAVIEERWGWLNTRKEVVDILRRRAEELLKEKIQVNESRIREGRGTYLLEGKFEVMAGSEEDALRLISGGGVEPEGYKHFVPFPLASTVTSHGRIR